MDCFIYLFSSVSLARKDTQQHLLAILAYPDFWINLHMRADSNRTGFSFIVRTKPNEKLLQFDVIVWGWMTVLVWKAHFNYFLVNRCWPSQSALLTLLRTFLLLKLYLWSVVNCGSTSLDGPHLDNLRAILVICIRSILCAITFWSKRILFFYFERLFRYQQWVGNGWPKSDCLFERLPAFYR